MKRVLAFLLSSVQLMLIVLFVGVGISNRPCFAATGDIVYTVGTQFSFADHATDFSGGTATTSLEVGTPTDVQIDTTSVGDTAARESAKVDLGASRATMYSLMVAVEMAATPTTGDVIEFYWNASPQSTAANGNSGYCTGADAAYTGGVATLAEGIDQLMHIGNFVCSADATATVQVGQAGEFSPAERYGSLVVKNESGAAFHSDAVETHFIMTPIITLATQ